MLIFGWGKPTFKDYGLDRTVMCERCHNEVRYAFLHRRTWFTLFWIPVIPTSSAYLVVCPVCSNAIEMPKATWDQRRQDAGLN